MPQRINLSDECVNLIESLTPLGCGLEKVKMMGHLYEVPVDDKWYRHLQTERRPNESWSDVIMRLIREGQRLADMRDKL